MLQDATSERNRVQKILEDANVKLASVLADPFGVSGQLMLEALLKGEAGARDAGKLRQEGKEYVVHDGDVMNFRFNV